MKKEIKKITCNKTDVSEDLGFLLLLQKAMLLSLLESKKLSQYQYECAVEELEKNFRNK